MVVVFETLPPTLHLEPCGCLTKQMAWDSSLALVPGSPQVPFLQSSARGTEPLPQVRGEKEMLGTSAASCLPIPLPASTPPGAHGWHPLSPYRGSQGKEPRNCRGRTGSCVPVLRVVSDSGVGAGGWGRLFAMKYTGKKADHRWFSLPQRGQRCRKLPRGAAPRLLGAEGDDAPLGLDSSRFTESKDEPFFDLPSSSQGQVKGALLLCSGDERRSGWNCVEIPIVLWVWGRERIPLAGDAPCSFMLESPLLLGFAGAIMGEGRPLAFFKETDSLGRCSMGLVCFENGEGERG